jgi:hypothetical protein
MHRAALGLILLPAIASTGILHAQRAAVPVAQTDEYMRYELLAPDTASFKVTFEVSVTAAGAREYRDRVLPGTEVVSESVVDAMTGAPLEVRKTAEAAVVALARPVPPDGQARLRIEKTVRSAKAYARDGRLVAFTQLLGARRGSVVLPSGFELVSCNVSAQVLSEADGRVGIAFMNQVDDARLVLKARPGAAAGAEAAPVPLTNARSWEPPPAQGPTERARLTERAHQDRDITYFLKEPATNAFSLFHDYTESRPGIDKYINVVREGSRVSNPSAYILDTGEKLRDETLKGADITAAKIDIGQEVTLDTEVVVVHFPPVKPGQSIRLRISETYTAPQSYRLQGQDLVFERSLGRPRNSVVLPAGWYLTASSIPAVVSEMADGRIRLDFVNGRPDSIDVLIKGRRRPGS